MTYCNDYVSVTYEVQKNLIVFKAYIKTLPTDINMNLKVELNLKEINLKLDISGKNIHTGSFYDVLKQHDKSKTIGIFSQNAFPFAFVFQTLAVTQ